MNLPPDFVQTIQNTFKKDGMVWLSAFPDLLEDASRCWELTDITPVPNLSYNFVAFASRKINREDAKGVKKSLLNASQALSLSARNGYRGEKEKVILKMGVPNNELHSEIAALRYFDGNGICHLLDADPQKGMLLLERLLPGRTLATVTDDENATRIAANVMKKLWKPAPENRDDFIQLRDWFDGFERLRQRHNGGTGKLPKYLVETAESLSRDLLAENKDETLLHGDFHHFNVLESARGWLAIDPKGVVGPRGYELGPLLINPIPDFLNGHRLRRESNHKAQTEKRIAILAEMLGMEQERIRNWAICHAVLSARWSIEDNDPVWGEYSLRCAEIFISLKR